MRTTARVAFLLLAMGTAGFGTAAAQTKTGTTIVQFMSIEPSARIAGMGNTGAALGTDLQSAYYNVAALGALDRTHVQLSHSEWYAGVDFEYAAGAFPMKGIGTFLLSVTALNSGDILVRTVDAPHGTGEFFTVNDLALGLGYGRQITSRFAAGAQLNYASETIWNSSLHILTFNVGTIYRLTEGGLKLGACVNNIGTRTALDGRDLAIQYDADPDRNGDNSALPATQFTEDFPVPVLFRVGLSYPYALGARSRLLLAVDAFHPSDNSESVSVGGEWLWRDSIALRAGYQQLFQQDSDVGVTLGVGLRGGVGYSRFHLDYAWADHEYLEETHRLTFAVDF
jgi:long-subunit fatty acid transport protein